MIASEDTRALGPRQRLLDGDAQSLTDAELVAELLGGGGRLRDGAAALLEACDGLDGLMSRNLRELRRARGLGPARIARLRASLELGRRYLERPVRRRQELKSPTDAACCFKARLADLPYEVFACVFLDTRHRLIGFEALFRGTIDGATVHPREVARRALDLNAAAVIAGHNHPSGSSEPSEADRRITARLKQSLELLDIRLLDHLVVARDGHTSLAELGWL